MPRPTRFRSSRGCAGARLVRFSCFSGIFDLHEVADLAEHSGERRRLLVLGAAADAAEPERTQGTPMPPGLPDLGPGLRDEELGHLAVVLLPAKPPRREPPRPPRAPQRPPWQEQPLRPAALPPPPPPPAPRSARSQATAAPR